MDSYQNILFSIIQFWRSTSRWPNSLTIVSHAFKRRRLVEAHCSAIAFPLEKVQFIGINPPGIPEVVDQEEEAETTEVRFDKSFPITRPGKTEGSDSL